MVLTTVASVSCDGGERALSSGKAGFQVSVQAGVGTGPLVGSTLGDGAVMLDSTLGSGAGVGVMVISTLRWVTATGWCGIGRDKTERYKRDWRMFRF